MFYYNERKKQRTTRISDGFRDLYDAIDFLYYLIVKP